MYRPICVLSSILILSLLGTVTAGPAPKKKAPAAPEKVEEKKDEAGKPKVIIPVVRYGIMVIPSFMREPAGQKLLGAKRTLIVPVRPAKIGKGYDPVSPEEIKKLGIGLDGWLERAGEEMGPLLRQLRPRFVASTEEGGGYGILEFDHPLTPSLIFAPGFADLFREKLGKTLLVAIPDQSHIYVFPGEGSEMEAETENLQIEFKNSANPASCEIFFFRKDDIKPRILGTFAPEGD